MHKIVPVRIVELIAQANSNLVLSRNSLRLERMIFSFHFCYFEVHIFSVFCIHSSYSYVHLFLVLPACLSSANDMKMFLVLAGSRNVRGGMPQLAATVPFPGKSILSMYCYFVLR